MKVAIQMIYLVTKVCGVFVLFRICMTCWLKTWILGWNCVNVLTCMEIEAKSSALLEEVVRLKRMQELSKRVT